MTFDASTLTFARAIVSFVGGLILLMVWWHDRKAWAALWWAGVNCGLGIGIAMLALHTVLPAYSAFIVGPLILDACAALTWVSAQIFNRGSVKPFRVFAAVGAWIAILIFAGAVANEQLAVAIGVAISGCLYAAAGVEFWLARRETLRGRWPMIGVLGLEAIALFLAAIEYASSRLWLPLPSVSWFGIIHFVGFVYAVGSALFLVMMLKGRSEAQHKAAALVDPLTGLPNRRAFMDRAGRLFERAGRDDAPISLLAFDLDRFKEINDTFGHPAGDHVLRIFADVLARALRPSDIAGRLGGEEFAIAMPGCGVPVALALAARIRTAFEGDARFVNGKTIGATVSVGVATAAGGTRSLAEIIMSADGALYQAKGLGRNRVVLADGAFGAPKPPVLALIA